MQFKLKRTDKGHHGKIHGMQLNETGELLFTAAQDGQLLLWNAHTGNEIGGKGGGMVVRKREECIHRVHLVYLS